MVSCLFNLICFSTVITDEEIRQRNRSSITKAISLPIRMVAIRQLLLLGALFEVRYSATLQLICFELHQRRHFDG